MRFPTIHTFLKWFAPSLLAGLIAATAAFGAIAQAYPKVKTWGEDNYLWLEPVVSAPWFLLLLVALIASYVWALVYTGAHSPSGEALRAYEIEKARQRAIDEAESERRRREQKQALKSVFGLNLGDAFIETEKDRKAEREVARLRKIAEASNAPPPFSGSSIKSRFDQRFPEIRRKFEAILANPIPNITMKDALGLIAEKAHKDAVKARDELQDLASIGAVAVWGRSYEHKDPNPLLVIPASAWTDHFMFWWDEGKTETDHQGVTQYGTAFAHRDLRFCKEQLIDHYATRR
jgi:hypothetical protein